MKHVPFKNYIIVSVIGLFTIFVAIFASKMYLEQKKKMMEINIDFATEVMENELDNFIVENHDIMIYVTDASTVDMEINKKIKSIVENGNYKGDVIHFDMTNSEANSAFSKYNSKNYAIKGNSLIIIKNEQIVNVVDLSKAKSYIKNHIEYYYGE